MATSREASRKFRCRVDRTPLAREVPSVVRDLMRAAGVALLAVACSSGAGDPLLPTASQDAARDLAFLYEDAQDPAPDTAQEDTLPPPEDVSPPPEDAPSGLGPPYPVVLAHGFAGFRDLGPVNYYFNVAQTLRRDGETVYESEVAPFLPPRERAPMLGAFLDRVLRETRRRKVLLIAHSQGGLDARYLITTLRYGDRVAALVTVSTPHRGTRLADALLAGTRPGADGFLNAVATLFGFAYNDVRTRADLRATLQVMSTAGMEAFNRENPDVPGVHYLSLAGRSGRRDGRAQCADGERPDDPSRLDTPFLPLLATVAFLEDGDPVAHVNDGLVEVQSARWGRFLGCVPADHLDEVGQPAHLLPNLESGFDHLAMYRDVLRRLRREGL
jgi:triacylglycerol lipase